MEGCLLFLIISDHDFGSHLFSDDAFFPPLQLSCKNCYINHICELIYLTMNVNPFLLVAKLQS